LNKLLGERAKEKRLLGVSCAGNQMISAVSLNVWILEPIKGLLHLASLASGSLHRCSEPECGGK
jgi:hypothetical protein